MILLSAGHYPRKPGACFGAFCEHEEAVLWCNYVMRDIKAMGYACDVTKTGRLSNKVVELEKVKASLSVEIHFNSARDSQGKHVGQGTETLYYPNSFLGKLSAIEVQVRLAPVFGRDRGIKEGWYQMNPDKGADHFLRARGTTCLIIEPEFIQFEQKIISYRGPGSKSIAQGLIAAYEIIKDYKYNSVRA